MATKTTVGEKVDEFLRCIAGCKGLTGDAEVACIKGCADVVVASPQAQQVKRESSEDERNERISKALGWVRDNSDVRTAAREAAVAPGLTLPDSLMANPSAIVTAIDAAIGAAKKNGAPDEVLTTLGEVATRYKAGAKRLKELDYSVRTLGGLKGMRDRFEFETPLVHALANAPDAANREKLGQLIALIRRPRSFEAGFPVGGDFVDGGCDWGCCAFACILCDIGCIACCAAACLLC